jgi:hypothetical protein
MLTLHRDPTLPADDLPLLAYTPQLLADVVSAMAAAGEHPSDEDDSQVQHADVVGLLGRLDPASAPAHPVLVQAVARYLQPGILPAELLTDWLRYAYPASRRLRDIDEHDRVTVAAMWAHLLVLQGSPAQAADVQGEVIASHQRAGDIRACLHARIKLAGMLHTAGRCQQAADEIEQIRQIWERDWRLDRDLGVAAVYQCLIILHGCARKDAVRKVLADPARTRITAGFGVAHFDDIRVFAAAHEPICTLYAARTADPATSDIDDPVEI